MHWGRLGRGAGSIRRLRATCAVALALVFGGVGSGVGADAARSGGAPLAYHATVLNGTITGSGFLISEGVAVTNAHVVGRTRPGAEMVIVVHGPGGAARRVRARVLAVSPRMDLAVLSVPRGMMPVAPALDAPLDRGRPVRAAGVVARVEGPGPRMELDGRIASSVLTLHPFGPGLIAEMPGIRRGFSGGPVFDREGRLVGMVAALRPDPGPAMSATGDPMGGREAFVLAAPAVRAEAARLLAGVSGR